jgi:hypothetical protein
VKKKSIRVYSKGDANQQKARELTDKMNREKNTGMEESSAPSLFS